MISRATVYKTVETLKGMGTGAGDGVQWGWQSLRWQAGPSPILTSSAGAADSIQDLELPALMREAKEVAERTGYELLGHRLDFYGLCPDLPGGMS